MSALSDALLRISRLGRAITRPNYAKLRSATESARAGDLATATALMDEVEIDSYPALAGGGGSFDFAADHTFTGNITIDVDDQSAPALEVRGLTPLYPFPGPNSGRPIFRLSDPDGNPRFDFQTYTHAEAAEADTDMVISHGYGDTGFSQIDIDFLRAGTYTSKPSFAITAQATDDAHGRFALYRYHSDGNHYPVDIDWATAQVTVRGGTGSVGKAYLKLIEPTSPWDVILKGSAGDGVLIDSFGVDNYINIIADSLVDWSTIVVSTYGIRLYADGVKRFETDQTGIGFFAATPVAKPTVSGSRGANAALASLLTALANLGLVTDSSS